MSEQEYQAGGGSVPGQPALKERQEKKKRDDTTYFRVCFSWNFRIENGRQDRSARPFRDAGY